MLLRAGAGASLAFTLAFSPVSGPLVAQQVALAPKYTSRDFVGDWTCQVTDGQYIVVATGTVRSDGTTVGYGTAYGHRTPTYEDSWSYAPTGPRTGIWSLNNAAFYKPSFSATAAVTWQSANRYTSVTLTDTNKRAVGSRTSCARKGSEKDDCPEVKQFLQEAVHFRNEYNDPTLIAQAKKNHWTGQQFEDAVRAKDKADAKSSGTAAGVEGAYTSENCHIHLNAATLQKAGLLPVEIDSTLLHEQVHQSDCIKAKASGKPQDTWQFEQKTENDAYNAEIAFLEKWISANC